MSNQQSGSSLSMIAARLILRKKVFLIVAAIVLLLFMVPMCAAIVAVDNSNPPFDEKDLMMFKDVGDEEDIFFVDLMIYYLATGDPFISKNKIYDIAERFKYTRPVYVGDDPEGNPIIIYEDEIYTIEEMFDRLRYMSSDEKEMYLQLHQIWSMKFGMVGDIGELPFDYVIPNSPFVWPTPTLNIITSLYGMRWGEPHYGVDIAGPNALGAPIVATADGVVTEVRINPREACGLSIRLRHDDGYESRYCHLSIINVQYKDEVSKGDVIGAVGNTGHSTGPHLHFEMKKDGQIFDPLPYILESRP